VDSTATHNEDSNLQLKLPNFSATVINGLRDNDSITVWSMMIEQLAHFYLDNYANRLKTSADYKEIGRMMFRKYPSIKRYRRLNLHLSFFKMLRSTSYKFNVVNLVPQRRTSSLEYIMSKP